MRRSGVFLLGIWLCCGSLQACGQEIRCTALPQLKLSVKPGQYSGITYVSDDRYAVVDDKKRGGGILFFDIPIDENGVVRTAQVQCTVPSGTAAATGSSPDNEGVVYANGKLYVSAENQTICEYDLDGVATGKSFTIPADMRRKSIAANGGFEALAYNEVTGRFWTTTEFPLKRDTVPPRLHRLQRFDADFQADARYLYQMDEPVKTAAEGKAAWAYVFGIPAMTALDDGRLLVLEREVYVPRSRPMDIFSQSFTKTKIYLVDPSGNPAEILPKQLLCEFETRMAFTASGIDVALANYEGMCLGPRLPDGRRCLVLIADSQAGMASLAASFGRKQLTCEFVKVLLLEGRGI